MNDNEAQIEVLNKKVEKLELEIKQIKQSFEPLSESKRKELLKESFNRALSEFAANGTKLGDVTHNAKFFERKNSSFLLPLQNATL